MNQDIILYVLSIVIKVGLAAVVLSSFGALLYGFVL